MMDIETLRSLQTRIRESKGADREIDAKIYAWHHGDVYVDFSSLEDGWLFKFGNRADCLGAEDLPRYTLDPDGLGA